MGDMKAISQFLSLVLICSALALQLLRFPVHAEALKGSPFYSGGSDSGWSGERGRLSLDQLTSILRDEAVQRLQELGQVSDREDFLQRTFMSGAAIRAGHLIRSWMEDAGLFTWVDDFGNVHGRYNGFNASAPALLLGSHVDTVVDAGQYDGALGIISAISAVKALQKSGRLGDFPRPIEVIAFSDEEGIRFQSTFLGSGAIAGTLPSTLLQVTDKTGATLEAVLKSASLPGTAESLFGLKYDPSAVWGYVEIHIEQGPVLESRDLPLGVVDAIAGQTRLRVTMRGLAGHAGTVPMLMRRDPMPAAALAIVAIDDLCMHPQQMELPDVQDKRIVCTIGEITVFPGASNVIAGEVTFSVDVRAKSDRLRVLAISTMEDDIHKVCKNRGVECKIEKNHEAKTVECDSTLTEKLRRAGLSATTDLYLARGRPGIHQRAAESLPTISSGAGHDAMAMAQFTKVGMMFVRCFGGYSHSPLESVMDDDVLDAGLALYYFLETEL